MPVLLYGWTTGTLTKHLEEVLDRDYRKMLRGDLKKSWKQHPTKQPLTSHLTNRPSETNDTCEALLDKQELTRKRCSPVDYYTWTHQWFMTSENLYSSALCRHYVPRRKPAESDYWLGRMVQFTNPSARAGYDTRSIFKRSLTGLNSEFSFS